MSNRQLDDMQDEKRDREIADQLGITFDELGETIFSIEDHKGNDGAVYGHYIRFDENSSKEVLAKIAGLENFCIDIHFTDDPDEDYFDSHDDGNGLLTGEEQKLGDQLLPYLAEQAKKKRDEEN